MALLRLRACRTVLQHVVRCCNMLYKNMLQLMALVRLHGGHADVEPQSQADTAASAHAGGVTRTKSRFGQLSKDEVKIMQGAEQRTKAQKRIRQFRTGVHRDGACNLSSPDQRWAVRRRRVGDRGQDGRGRDDKARQRVHARGGVQHATCNSAACNTQRTPCSMLSGT